MVARRLGDFDIDIVDDAEIGGPVLSIRPHQSRVIIYLWFISTTLPILTPVCNSYLHVWVMYGESSECRKEKR
jgi:hypothetical protein